MLRWATKGQVCRQSRLSQLHGPCRSYLPIPKWINKDYVRWPADETHAVRQHVRRASRALWTLGLAVGVASMCPDKLCTA